jgi:hypothetical protein
VLELPEHPPHERLDALTDAPGLRLAVARDVEHPDAVGLDELDGLGRPADTPVDDQEQLAVVAAGVERRPSARRLVVAEPDGAVRGPDVRPGAGGEPGLVALDQAEALEQLAGTDLARERLPRLGVDRALGQPSLRGEPAGGDVEGAGRAEGGLVGAGLTAADDPVEHAGQCTGVW